ncbi:MULTISPECIES: hypothetical protein [Pseudomonas]|uniref:DUF1120 domain-containing protein n=1 Tax=Pseudomonas koreensis TaxID=198620 RepID=A0AA94JJB5_9PSED|nr:hypothetical protein [Pseudomonas koreensis]RVD79396.1 hypothetical protein A9HBioS_1041 [Pseudomonas koreensis]
MKLRVVAALLICLLSSFAWGADECRLALSPAGVDFGSVNRAELLARSVSGGADASLGVRSLHLRIQCAVPRAMTWGFAAPVADPQRYRWTAGTLQIRMVAARLDGVAVQMKRTGDEVVEANLLRPGDRVVTWRSGAVASGSHLEVDLQIEARVDEASSRVRDLTRHEAYGTFQLD